MSIKQCCGLGRCVMTKDLQECSACRGIAYCSKDHQTEHFKDGHKFVCSGRAKGPLTFNECVEKASRYYSDKMWVAALPYYAAILELTERSLDIFHPQNALALEAMLICYENQSKFAEAIQCLQRVIIILEMTNEEGNIEKNKKLFSAMGKLGELYLKAGQAELAREMLKKMEASAVEVFGEQSFERGRALMSLASCYEQESNTEEAVKSLEAAITLENYGATKEVAHKAVVANAFLNLGIIFNTQGKAAEALPHFEKALELKKASGLAQEDPDVLEAVDYVNQTKEKIAAAAAAASS